MLIEADLVPPDLVERARSFIAPLWSEKKKEAVSVSGMSLLLHAVTSLHKS